MQQRQQLVDGGVKRAGNAASQGPPGKMIVFLSLLYTGNRSVSASRLGEQLWRRLPTCFSRRRTQCSSSRRWILKQIIIWWLLASQHHINNYWSKITVLLKKSLTRRALIGRPTGNCWRPWWGWRRVTQGGRRRWTRWRSCRWKRLYNLRRGGLKDQRKTWSN